MTDIIFSSRKQGRQCSGQVSRAVIPDKPFCLHLGPEAVLQGE